MIRINQAMIFSHESHESHEGYERERKDKRKKKEEKMSTIRCITWGSTAAFMFWCPPSAPHHLSAHRGFCTFSSLFLLSLFFKSFGSSGFVCVLNFLQSLDLFDINILGITPVTVTLLKLHKISHASSCSGAPKTTVGCWVS
jgi:hypothetical protein